MKIDMHIHTREYSNCAESPIKDQLQAASDRGIDAVFITDHMQLFPEKKLDKLRKVFPELRIFQGIEVTVQKSGWEDFIVLGIHNPDINGDKWTYPELYKYVRKNNGYIIHAHPYRYSDKVASNTSAYPPDAVEIMSSNLQPSGIELRTSYAKKLGAIVVSNSDSHHISRTGKYYTELDGWYDYEEDIIEALRAGKILSLGY